MKDEHINEIKAIIILAVGMILLASLISFVPQDLSWYSSHPNVPAKNLIRITGATVAGGFLFVFGYSAYALVLFLFFWSWNKFSSRDIHFTWSKLVSSCLLICVISALFSMMGPQDSVFRFERAGIVGLTFSDFLVGYLGKIGSYIILIALGTMALILTGEFLVSPLFLDLFERTKGFWADLNQGLLVRKPKAPAATKPNINLAQTLALKQAPPKPKPVVEKEPASSPRFQEPKEEELRKQEP